MAQCSTQRWKTESGVTTITTSNWFWYLFFTYWNNSYTVTWIKDKSAYVSSWLLDFYIGQDPNLYVLASIPNQYGLVYQCSNFLFGLGRNEYVWYLSRSTDMPQSTVDALNSILKVNLPNFDTTQGLVQTIQGSTCTYPG
mgnify:CR=1 FL=1